MAFSFEKPFRTADGDKATLLAKVNNEAYPFVVLITREDGHQFPETYTADGKVYAYGTESHNDLVNVDVTYFNLYPSTGCATSYKQSQHALENLGNSGFTVSIDSDGNIEVIKGNPAN